MQFKVADVILLAIICLFNIFDHSLAFETRLQESTENTEDYCMLESFQPRCQKNEAILINSATYGRMRIGRCITEEEINTFGSAFGDNPKILGCSADVLEILDAKCSGKTSCDIRLLEISNELTTKPCLPGLNVYLEVSYECISVADGDRSCSVSVSNVPIHIFASSESQRKCATKTQPWVIEAPSGQKIKITLIDFFSASQFSENEEEKKKSCLGVIVDKTAKRNVSICVGGEQRTKYLYSSAAETLEIYYNAMEQEENDKEFNQFALKLEAVGCSDLIAPEDAWLKRNDDSIVIGCYSNRQTWQLHCQRETWIGVFGNCSQNNHRMELSNEELELRPDKWSDEQILTVVAVGGFIVTIGLVVLCTGIVCLRKFSTKKTKKEDYRVLDFQFNSSNNKSGIESMQSSVLPSAAIVNDVHRNSSINQQVAPTYSVFVGEGDFQEDQTNYLNNGLLTR